MPWHRVFISHLNPTAQVKSEESLMIKFDAAYRKALEVEIPPDVAVFHKSHDDKHVFYFSPKASEIAHDLLSEFSSVPCAGEPELSGFHKIWQISSI